MFHYTHWNCCVFDVLILPKQKEYVFPSMLQLQSFVTFPQILLTGAWYFHKPWHTLSGKTKTATLSVAINIKENHARLAQPVWSCRKVKITGSQARGEEIWEVHFKGNIAFWKCIPGGCWRWSKTTASLPISQGVRVGSHIRGPTQLHGVHFGLHWLYRAFGETDFLPEKEAKELWSMGSKQFIV